MTGLLVPSFVSRNQPVGYARYPSESRYDKIDMRAIADAPHPRSGFTIPQSNQFCQYNHALLMAYNALCGRQKGNGTVQASGGARGSVTIGLN